MRSSIVGTSFRRRGFAAKVALALLACSSLLASSAWGCSLEPPAPGEVPPDTTTPEYFQSKFDSAASVLRCRLLDMQADPDDPWASSGEPDDPNANQLVTCEVVEYWKTSADDGTSMADPFIFTTTYGHLCGLAGSFEDWTTGEPYYGKEYLIYTSSSDPYEYVGQGTYYDVSGAVTPWEMVSEVELQVLGDPISAADATNGTDAGEPANVCTLCADGSTPPVDLDVVVFEKLVEGINLTCGDLMDEARAIADPDGEECAKMQREGLALCECPATEEEEAEACTLCQDGAPFDSTIEFIKDWGCGTIATYVSADSRPNACMAYQSTIGVYCGCPYEEGEVPVCHLCGEGTLLPEPGRFVVGSDGEDEKSCANLEFDATREYDTCADVTALYGEACCRPTAAGAPVLGDVVAIEDEEDAGEPPNVAIEEKEGDEGGGGGALEVDAASASTSGAATFSRGVLGIILMALVTALACL